jgi:Zn-dependent protease
MDKTGLLLLGLPQLFFAVILHEVAHGVVAEWCGDSTARRLGRITLNPLPHIDPWMTIGLPAILILSGAPFIFGGAKPVPVNIANLGSPKRDMGLVAAAGPLVNFSLAFIYALLIVWSNSSTLQGQSAGILSTFLSYGFVVNLVLALFNLTPILPLDGGRILVSLLPAPMARQLSRLEPFGFFIVVALLMTGVLNATLGPMLDFIGGLFLNTAILLTNF